MSENPFVKTFDSLVNLVSGLGTSKDKSTHSTFQFTPTAVGQLESAYRGDWIARKIVEIPAQDATREWRHWVGDQSQTNKIEELEESLELRKHVTDAIIKSRLYGGAALYMGLPGSPDKEITNIEEGQLEFVRVLPKWELAETEIIRDIASPYYGRSEFFNVTTSSGGFVQMIHASRLILLVPKPVPRMDQVWGDSVLDAVIDAVKKTGTVLQASAALVEEAKTDIIKIPEFLKNVGNTEYRDRVLKRFQLANQGKSIVNALLLDTQDEHSRIVSTFAGLPDVMRVYLLVASGAADIPATRMLGQSPAGLSATGESDLRNYYDSVGAYQRNSLGTALKPLDRALVNTAIGRWPDGLEVEWLPLWQMTSHEKAQRDLVESQVFQIDAALGLFNDEVLKQARIAQLEQANVYPGLEQIIEEFGDIEDDNLDEDDDDVRAQFNQNRGQEDQPSDDDDGDE